MNGSNSPLGPVAAEQMAAAGDVEQQTFGRFHGDERTVTLSEECPLQQSVLIDVRSATPILRTIKLALSSQTYKVDVVSATPLAGTDLATDQIAGPT